MNTPPRKLLKVVKKISANKPGIAPTITKVPRISSFVAGWCSLWITSLSGIDIVKRWMIETAIVTIPSSSTRYIPANPTRKPLIAETIRKAMPVAVPVRPFALSRPSSGNRIVTMVGSAIPRMFPAITPISSSGTKIQSVMLVGSLKASRPAVR